MAAPRLAKKVSQIICSFKLLLLGGVGGGSPSSREQNKQEIRFSLKLLLRWGVGGGSPSPRDKKFWENVFLETFVALGGGGWQPLASPKRSTK